MPNTLEQQILALDQAISDAEKHAKLVLSRLAGLRKKNAGGEIGSMAALFEPVPALIEQLSNQVQTARVALTYDVEAALSDGSYVRELRAAAEAGGVAMIEHEGRLTAFPLLLKLEPRQAGVRVGRKMERRLRPSAMVQLLRKAQASTKFDAGRFLARLFDAYAYLAPIAQPGWRSDRQVRGPVVALNDLYTLLTLLPAAAADYSREEFAIDLLRLDTSPDTKTSGGHQFTLPASTGTKGRNRLTVFDEAGTERLFVSIQFSLGAAG